MLYLKELVTNAITDIEYAQSIADLDNIRVKYLGKNGYLTIQMTIIRNLPIEERPKLGAMINEVKQQIREAINIRKKALEFAALNEQLASEIIDVSLPGRRVENGGLHPVTRTIDRIEIFFRELGFSIVRGPEIEDDYYNFDALNIPDYHPSRADHDTFWFDAKRLLRTQTSSIQIRTMKNTSLPIRIIAPGRVYRNDYDQTHTPMFHQVEGLIVDDNINFTNLKSMIHDFLCNFFEKKLQIRFRPSYFPFTEPSAEVDVMGKNGKWLEVIGCGMVHPNVMRNVNIDSEVYSGLAFGIGIERLTMLRYGIADLRAFFENDLRFLKQFK